ncbi:MAG: succinate dehydrogenase, cytochrome b556 subunit [Planctomycetes bacterium]|nr:succinate dehydrogenase, cytochrome b556 subunit [Planctomycetota bacterium]
MKLSNALSNTKNDILLNPNAGTFSYVLHRLTGLALAGYIFAHIIVLSAVLSGPESFTQRLALVQTGIFHYLEIGLIAVIFIHMLNGLRITVADFANLTRLHKTLLWLSILIFCAIMAVTFYVFLF